ncbi:MAG TPA: M24 family metallopeptidase [Spirochaetes bacterium]|nr:M24 family metallopeptidase [Spirochaetota bacterium]
MNIKQISFEKLETPLDLPILTESEIRQRHALLTDRMKKRGLSHVVVYGDREHFANMSYLTGGYDPRFEEALLILDDDGKVNLIVGNEGYDYSNISPFTMEKKLFPTFSLQGMIRNNMRYIKEIFEECGIGKSAKIGIVGLKYYEDGEVETPDQTYDIPHYLIEGLFHVVTADSLSNVTEIMNHPIEGIRCTLSAAEIARVEIMGTYLSNQMKAIIESLEVGMSEADAISHFDYRGVPFNVHPVVNFGTRRVLLGLASPSFGVRLEAGDPVSIGLSVEGTSIARTGLAVNSGEDFKGARINIINEFYNPYFKATKTWYETVKVGASSRSVFDNVMSILGDKKFGVSLNPGHQIHMEEWINSPFRPDRDHRLVSGMALQCDIIAFPGEPYVGAHVEDTMIIADEALRNEIIEKYPQVWKRITIKKDMMRKTLGINIDDSLLPVSTIQAHFHPFLLDPSYTYCGE